MVPCAKEEKESTGRRYRVSHITQEEQKGFWEEAAF